eukprot:CAMPEP_0170206640 /NCGR_PEP_ID=MMETSP0116_2-20130129/2886_1 /TAXON_ID=400756 /ORGANISM="Durinskia baltica, Strain CSIRO CS-38" /LENGTH=236 /DNA_ID=CAMNT_0010457075 /DNA_START=115 /DNA_END=821 /DNA_ORIENTATION=+
MTPMWYIHTFVVMMVVTILAVQVVFLGQTQSSVWGFGLSTTTTRHLFPASRRSCGNMDHPTRLFMTAEDSESEAERLRKQAETLREQIRAMEASLELTSARAQRNTNNNIVPEPKSAPLEEPMSLKKKRVLVVGANGRLGSMVCRHLLRTHPQTEVVACVHTVSENSPTARGYGRLSYEVGAEDGIGKIGAAWSAEDRTATFEYADYMKDYNLQNLRLVECELLDPVQCTTICEGV